ncbi:MAG: TetR/AcrR family transcriptional regulator [Pseudomonadota bacterium]
MNREAVLADKASPTSRIVSAARRLFFKHGFASVTTDMLAKEASCSKATLYKYYPNKLDLLTAVVEVEGHRFWIDAGKLPDDKVEYTNVLKEYGRNFLALLSDKDIRGFEHLMISESTSHPEGAATFYEKALRRTLDELSRVIAHGQRIGVIVDTYKPEHLADMLICAWKGMTHSRLQLSLEARPYTDRDNHVIRCMAVILGL